MSQDLDILVSKVKKAYDRYKNFTQEQVDKIVIAAAIAANSNRLYLSRMAIEETGMGVFEDKVIKIHFAAEFVCNKYRNEKTCGIIEHNNFWGIYKVADSMGIIAAITPVTNPTSTVVFKALLALKTRNAIIFAPHPNSKRSSCETARIMLEAAVAAGAPADIIGWIEEPSLELTQKLMQHKDTAIILATGGPGLIKAAYSSGKPAIGVGPGNVPALIDETADIKTAVTSILTSKTFDNGVICASEQSLVVVDVIYEEFKNELLSVGAYFVKGEERNKLAQIILVNGSINPKIVGRAAVKIADLAGFTVPENTKVLIAEASEVGPSEPLSHEKLSPVLALYRVKDFDEGLKKAEELIEYGGAGHTAILHTGANNKGRIEKFGESLDVIRSLINIPGAFGAIGDVYNFYLEPSLTLGCGTYGGNVISGNVGVKHLLNTKIIAERRENMLWFRVPPQIYFKSGCLPTALQSLKGRKRAFIVTDRALIDLGYQAPVEDTLRSLDIQYEIYSEIKLDPDYSIIKQGIDLIRSFKPDTIIALGGGDLIDAAKIIWLMYDYPDIKLQDLSMRFMDIRKRLYFIPEKASRTFFVAVPTTSGRGSEVTPFALVSDKGVKYPIADYALTPNMAILDPFLVKDMPKHITALGGFDAVMHAVETFVAVFATDYTNALAKEALRLLFKYLPIAYADGAKNLEARERVHYAATMAGMAVANAYLGLGHSMSHQLGGTFNIPHGMANALVINQVIHYNCRIAPTKYAAFPQYRIPLSLFRYAKLADVIGVGGNSEEEKVELLLRAITELKQRLDLPLSIKDTGVPEDVFMQKLDEITELAFDDQCTGVNPRYPLLSEIRELYIKAYKGE